MVTVASTVASEVSSLESVTTRGLVVEVLRVTVPVVAAAPSTSLIELAPIVTVRVATSLSVTVNIAVPVL